MLQIRWLGQELVALVKVVCLCLKGWEMALAESFALVSKGGGGVICKWDAVGLLRYGVSLSER